MPINLPNIDLSSLVDRTPSAGANVWGSFGKGLSSGIEMLLKQKLEEKQREYEAQIKEEQEQRKLQEAYQLYQQILGGGQGEEQYPSYQEQLPENMERLAWRGVPYRMPEDQPTPYQTESERPPQMRRKITPLQVGATELINKAAADALKLDYKHQQKEEDRAQRERLHREDLEQKERFHKEKIGLQEKSLQQQRELPSIKGENQVLTEYAKGIDSLREKAGEEEKSVNQMEIALKNGKLGFWSQANLSKLPGLQWLTTPDRELLEAAAKNDLLANLHQVKGQSNQFIQKTILGTLPQVGKPQKANRALFEAKKTSVEIDKAKIRIFDEEAQKDRERYGTVQPGIQARVDARLKPIKEEKTKQLSRKLWRMETGKKKLSIPKVKEGTPLTPEVYRYWEERWGRGDELDQALIKAGYRAY